MRNWSHVQRQVTKKVVILNLSYSFQAIRQAWTQNYDLNYEKIKEEIENLLFQGSK